MAGFKSGRGGGKPAGKPGGKAAGSGGKKQELTGGHWATIHGHAVYIKAGQIVAGHVPGVGGKPTAGHAPSGPAARSSPASKPTPAGKPTAPARSVREAADAHRAAKGNRAERAQRLMHKTLRKAAVADHKQSQHDRGTAHHDRHERTIDRAHKANHRAYRISEKLKAHSARKASGRASRPPARDLTAAEYAQHHGVTHATASEHLRTLYQKGQVKGGSRGGSYSIPHDAPPPRGSAAAGHADPSAPAAGKARPRDKPAMEARVDRSKAEAAKVRGEHAARGYRPGARRQAAEAPPTHEVRPDGLNPRGASAARESIARERAGVRNPSPSYRPPVIRTTADLLAHVERTRRPGESAGDAAARGHYETVHDIGRKAPALNFLSGRKVADLHDALDLARSGKGREADAAVKSTLAGLTSKDLDVIHHHFLGGKVGRTVAEKVAAIRHKVGLK